MEKKHDKPKSDGGEMGMGMILLLIVVGCFVIWVLTGGAEKADQTKPYVNPYTDKDNPLGTYGPGER